MSQPGELSLSRVIDMCRERDVRLAYEIGAFVVFEACEAVLAQPRATTKADVWISPEGATRVASGATADDADAAGALAELLAAVLVVAGQEVPGMLMHLVDVAHARQLGLAGYRDELEAALVPLNRAAARRVLARQLRELTKPRADARSLDPGSAGEDAVAADAALDALLGYEAPPTPEAEEHAEDTLPETLGEPAAPVALQRMREPTASTTLAGPSQVQVPLGLPREPDLDGVVEARTSRRTRGPSLALVVVIALIVGVGAYLWWSGQL